MPKITALPAASAANLTDLLAKVNDPSGSPVTQRVTLTQVNTLLGNLSGAGAPVAAPTITTQTAHYRDTSSGFCYRWDVQSAGWTPIPRIYSAIMNQAGTNAPVATVLANTIGAIVWTRAAAGEYNGTLAGAFPAAKVHFTGVYFTSLASGPNIFVRVSNNVVQIQTRDGGLGVDDLIEDMPITILVYP